MEGRGKGNSGGNSGSKGGKSQSVRAKGLRYNSTSSHINHWVLVVGGMGVGFVITWVNG